MHGSYDQYGNQETKEYCSPADDGDIDRLRVASDTEHGGQTMLSPSLTSRLQSSYLRQGIFSPETQSTNEEYIHGAFRVRLLNSLCTIHHYA